MELYYVITISDRDRAEILANIYQTAGTGMVLCAAFVFSS